MNHAAWARITKDDIPAEWRAMQVEQDGMAEAGGVSQDPQLQFHVALEMPDYPLCRAWMEWYASPPFPADVAVVVTAREAWSDRKEKERETLRSLIQYGKPAPVWVASWYRKAPVG